MTTSKMANRLGIRTLLEDATVLRTLLSSSGVAPTAHALLGSYHSDAVTDAVTRGSLVYGNATPQWDELVIGTAHQLLKVTAGGTDPAWTSFDWDDMAAGASADMVHSHLNASEGGLLSVAAISGLPTFATPALTLGTANAAGSANSVIRSDATILVFDVTVPTTIAESAAAAAGSAAVAARRDHVHGAPATWAATAHAASHHVGGGDLVNHDSLTGFVVNEHIDHSTVSIAVSGLGLSGGGTIAANRTITLTSSANPGAAASILASAPTTGYLQLTGLGIGVAPTYKLDISDTGNVPFRFISAYSSFVTSTTGIIYTTTGTSAAAQLKLVDQDSIGTRAVLHLQANAGATEVLWAGADGKAGIGTATIPHGGVGAALLALDGANASTAGPHVQYTTATDNYPVFQQLNLSHDNVALSFDAYYDGAWKSSDAGSNFQIYKAVDVLAFNYDSGIAQGSAVTWVNGMTMDTDGRVNIGAGYYGNTCGLSVYRSGAYFAAAFLNDGNNAAYEGLNVQCGADDGSGVTGYLVGFDGDGTEVGGLRNNSGTFQVYDVSDEATKTNIARTTRSGLDVIRQVEIYDYNRAKFPNGPRLAGTIAQNDLKLNIPGMVAEMRNGLLATSHSALIPFLVLAIQEQQETIERLTQLVH